MVIGFNIEVEGDLMFYRRKGVQHILLVLTDRGVRWTSACIVADRHTSTLLSAIDQSWISVFGPMSVLLFDGETGLDDEESTTYFQLRGIHKRTSAPNQHTRIVDRKIAVLRDSFHKMMTQLDDEGIQAPFVRIVCDVVYALNALTSINGRSPYEAVLGRTPAILPAEDMMLSDGVPDHCSRHTHRVREIAVQAIAEGTARERIKRATHTQTRAASEELQFALGQSVDYWREPVNKDSSGWRGPAVIADLTRLEHGRIGIRTSTDQVLTCRIQDVRPSIALWSEELAVFFGSAEDHIAPAGSQASYAQQYVQEFVDNLRPGVVVTLGTVRTADGRWVETPQTATHRQLYQAAMFIAETVFQLTSVVAVRLSRAVRTMTMREEFATALTLWWLAPASRQLNFLHSNQSKVSAVDMVGQEWQAMRTIQFLAVPDEEGWATVQRWSVPEREGTAADAQPAESTPSETSEQQRLSTIPEEATSNESSFSAWEELKAMFGSTISETEAEHLREAFIACSSESAPPHAERSDLAELRHSVSQQDAMFMIDGSHSSSMPPSLEHFPEAAFAAAVATSDVDPDNYTALDSDETGAYVALEVYGDFCKCIEGLTRMPYADEHVELRFYEGHSRKSVIDRSDDLLTESELQANAKAVTQAMIDELKTWQDYKCFKRRSRATAPCIIDAKWVYKWKYVKGERRIRARLCLRGFKETGADSQSNFAATASRFSQRLLSSECSLRGWTIASSDVPKAFLQGVSYSELAASTQKAERDVSFELTGEGLECLRALPEFATFDAAREVLHCLKPGTGCRDAPKCFSLQLRKVTAEFGLKCSSVDSELEFLHEHGQLLLAIIKHVDDLKMIGARKKIEEFIEHLSSTFGKMSIEWKDFVFCGVRHKQADDGAVTMDQIKFLSACKPITEPRALTGKPDTVLAEAERRHFMSLLMTVAYSLLTRPDAAVFVTALQRESHKAQVIHVKRLNMLLKWLQSTPRGITYPVMEYPDMLLQISDSSYRAKADDGLSVRGLVSVRVRAESIHEGLKIVQCHFVDWVSKAQRHVTRSTFSSELFAATDAVDSGLLNTVTLHELAHGPVTPDVARSLIEGTTQGIAALGLVIDAKSVSSAVVAPNVKVPAEPSLLLHVLWLRALLRTGRLKNLYWSDTRSMTADALTKGSVGRELLVAAMHGILQIDQPYEDQRIA